MALRLGIMIDRYNNHASRARTVLLSVTPSLDGKLFGALFGVGLFLNPQLLEQRRPSNSITYFQQIAGSPAVGHLEQSCAGLGVDPEPASIGDNVPTWLRAGFDCSPPPAGEHLAPRARGRREVLVCSSSAYTYEPHSMEAAPESRTQRAVPTQHPSFKTCRRG
jgi:hypothetical protein